MSQDLEKIVQEHAASLQDLKTKHENMQTRIEIHESHIDKLSESIASLKEKFGSVASKDDIAAVNAKIDESINGLLKDALNSVPHKIVALFTGALLLIAAIEAVIHIMNK
ncbi:MAG TPA: hypothetical protein VFM18_11755 [Methanosarcina sp.]|nr:hypothetical protein [Methanosarcina sp.]